MRKVFIAVSSALAIVSALATVAPRPVQAQDEGWVVPQEERAKPNPVENTPEAIAAGKALFAKNCVMCHGESGKGDGPATQYVKPAPADITTAEAQGRMTDGEIFYKITVGKRPMPAMNRKMDETERWQVVHYVRTLRAP